jgi:chemotaxis response regulator CheB
MKTVIRIILKQTGVFVILVRRNTGRHEQVFQKCTSDLLWLERALVYRLNS